jgi:hypothetical protein
LTVIAACTAVATPAAGQQLVISPKFEQAGNFHEHVAPAKQGGRWGLIDIHGKWVVQPQYEDMMLGSYARFGVRRHGLWGYIAPDGSVIVPPAYDEAKPFSGGHAAVKKNGLWGFITPSGQIETAHKFVEVGSREGSFLTARDPAGWALFNLYTGARYDDFIKESVGAGGRPAALGITRLRAVQLSRLFTISEGAFVARSGGHEWLVEVPTARFGFEVTRGALSIRRKSDGLAAVSFQSNLWGYMNDMGEEVISPRFEDARAFSNGFAPIKDGGKWGYISKTGAVVVTPRYDDAYPFRGEYAVVRLGSLRGFLKLQSARVAVLIAPRYEDVLNFTEGLAPVRIGGLWGFISDGQHPTERTFEREIVDLVPE